MKRLLILIFFLPLSLFGQSGYKSRLAKVYTQAIADFIKAANKRNNTSFDTLFFGKRANGQDDDFPDITLPQTIEKTQVRLITPEEGTKKQKEKPSRIYINLLGWTNRNNVKFQFIVFSNGFAHQYDYELNYRFDVKTKKLV